MFTRNVKGQFTKTLFPRSDKVVEKFADEVIEQSKKNLTKKGKKNTKLAKSLQADVLQKEKSFSLRFWAEDYSDFVDQGVGGSGDTKRFKYVDNAYNRKKGRAGQIYKNLPTKNKAPKSPYKFKKKFPPRSVLDKWAVKKSIKGVRDKLGQFIPRKTLVWFIQRNIFLTGLEPTYFFSDAFKKFYTSQFITDFENAYADDIENEWQTDAENQLQK